MYSTAKATALGTALPIQATGKMGYASTTVVDQANQFASKAYVDSKVSGVPAPDLNPYLQKAGGTMTGPIVLSGAPTADL
jgi:hypothetical protein